MPGTFSTNITTVAGTYVNVGSWTVNPVANALIYVEGTNAMLGMTGAANARYGFSLPVTSRNMSGGGSAGEAFFMWHYVSSTRGLNTKVNGGINLAVGSGGTTAGGTEPNIGLSNSKVFRVGGNDTDLFGGWTPRVLSPRATADATVGTPNTAAITGIHASIRMTAAGSDVTPNTGYDLWRVGSGHTFNNGTAVAPVTFADVTAYDFTNGTNSFGVCFDRQGSVVLQGKLFCGTAAQVALTYFKQTSKTITLPDNPVEDGFYELRVAANASFASTFQTGDYTGGVVTGACSFASINPLKRLTLSCADAFGAHKHYGLAASLAASTLNTVSELRQCSFSGSDALTPAGAIVNGCVFAGGTDAAMVFTAPSDATATAGCKLVGNAVGIRITAAGTYTLDGHTFSGNTVDIKNTSVGAVIINVVNGSNPVTTQNTGGGTTTINITAGATVSNLVTGTRVLIKRTDTGAVLFNGVETAGSISYSGTYVGQVTVIARKASGAPYYKEWTTLVGLVSGSSVSVTALQVLDT